MAFEITQHSLGGLPAEIQIAIRSQFSAKELAITSRVCKSWNKFNSDDLLWQKLNEKEFGCFTSINGKTAKQQYIEKIKKFKFFPPMLQRGNEKLIANTPIVKVTESLHDLFHTNIKKLSSYPIRRPLTICDDGRNECLLLLMKPEWESCLVSNEILEAVSFLGFEKTTNNSIALKNLNTFSWQNLFPDESVEEYSETIPLTDKRSQMIKKVFDGTHPIFSLTQGRMVPFPRRRCQYKSDHIPVNTNT